MSLWVGTCVANATCSAPLFLFDFGEVCITLLVAMANLETQSGMRIAGDPLVARVLRHSPRKLGEASGAKILENSDSVGKLQSVLYTDLVVGCEDDAFGFLGPLSRQNSLGPVPLDVGESGNIMGKGGENEREGAWAGYGKEETM